MFALKNRTARVPRCFFYSRHVLAGILAGVMGVAGLAQAALPDGFYLQQIVAGLALPTDIAPAPDGRLYVAEKRGVVQVIEGGSPGDDPFIDISDQVNAHADRGLLSIALDPAFPSRPYVFLLYTYDPPGLAATVNENSPDGRGNRVARLIRVTADASRNYAVAIPGSETVILGKASTLSAIGDPSGSSLTTTPSCESNGNDINDCIPVDEWSHTPGMLRFGLDGSLYVSSGDASHAAGSFPTVLRAQRLSSLSGKILRISADTGLGLPDNPHYTGNADDNASRVYARGLRNPFRLAVHPVSGRPYIGDVGWSTWEEVNAGPPGSNYGWPCFEGGNGTTRENLGYAGFTLCEALNADDMTAPNYAYNHNGAGASIIAGDFMVSSSWPQRWQGALLYGDFEDGRLNALQLDNAGNVIADDSFGTEQFGVVAMRRAANDDIYLVKIGEGAIDALRYSDGNRPPVARVTTTELFGPSPHTVTFDATASSDPDNDTLQFDWDFGNGQTASGAVVTKAFWAGTPADYFVTLTVSDPTSSVDRKRIRVAVNQVENTRPVVTMASPFDGQQVRVGDNIRLEASGSDAEDGALGGESISWTANLRHFGHVHSDFFTASGLVQNLAYPDHGDNTWLEICAIATDSEGDTTRLCREVLPQTSNVTIDSQPQGIDIDWGGTTRTTPFVVTSPVGSERAISVAQDQGPLGVFQNWSDGGGATHSVTVGPEDLTLVARFAVDGGSVEDDPITLIPAVVDPGEHGHDFGDDNHPASVRFAITGSYASDGEPLYLEFRGYDIDSADELSVSLNGDLVANALAGPNDAFAPVTRVLLPATSLVDGDNLLVFESSTPGTPWGVTDVLAMPAFGPVRILTPDAVDPAEIGYGTGTGIHPGGANFEFGPVDADGLLALEGLNILTDTDVAVTLNGTPLGYLMASGAGNSSVSEFAIPAALLAETNRLELRLTAPGTVWGVRDISVTSVAVGCQLDCGPILIVPGNPDPQRRGNGFGTNVNPTMIEYEFRSNRAPLYFEFRGFDINTATEVSISLNGEQIATATPGSAGKLKLTRFAAPLQNLVNGVNRITLKQEEPGTPWGVTQFKVMRAYGNTMRLERDVRDPNAYGYFYADRLRPGGLRMRFDGNDQSVRLAITGFNIVTPKLVEVFLNGRSLGHLAQTRALTAADNRFSVDRRSLRPKNNLLEFRLSRPGTRWGVRRILVETR